MPLCGKAPLRTLLLCCTAALNFNAFAQDGSSIGKCSFQKIHIASPAGTTATPTDLNDSGQMVGLLGAGSGPAFHISGFLLSNGKFSTFNFPGAADTFPRDINMHGTIVGSFDAASVSGQRAFIRQGGVFREIRLPGFPAAPAVATGVNDFGAITGQFNGNGSDLGFLLRNGKLTVLSFPGAAGGTFPASINNQGTIVGSYHLTEDDVDHGFMWKNGVFSNIRTLSGGSLTPKKISDNGDIVGTFVDSNIVAHGFSLDKGRFSVIDPPGSQSTDIFALNNFDNIIGVFATSAGNTLVKGFCSAVF